MWSVDCPLGRARPDQWKSKVFVMACTCGRCGAESIDTEDALCAECRKSLQTDRLNGLGVGAMIGLAAAMTFLLVDRTFSTALWIGMPIGASIGFGALIAWAAGRSKVVATVCRFIVAALSGGYYFGN